MKRKVGITIEGRMGSTRLPEKTMRPILGKPMLERMIERLTRVTKADSIIIATTDMPQDQPIVDLAKKLGVGHYQGSSEDVLDRVLKAAQKYEIDVIAETCADCPVIDPGIIDMEIAAFLENDVDYVGCHLKKTFPIGLDAKVFATKTLADVDRLTQDPPDRENVSLYIYEHPERYKLLNLEAKGRHRRTELRLVVDYKEDFILIEKIYQALYPVNPAFSYDDILDLFQQYPDLAKINMGAQNIAVAGRKPCLTKQR